MLRKLALLSLISLFWLSTPAAAQEIPRVTIDADKRPLLEILRELGKEHNLNYVTSRKAAEQAGEVYCHLVAVPLDRAVQMLCAACNLEAEVQGRFAVIRVPRAGKARFAFPTGKEAEPLKESASGSSPIFAPKGKKPGETKASKPAEAKRSVKAKSNMSTVIGNVTAKGKRLLKVKEDEGAVQTFHLPAEGSRSATFMVQLKKALQRLEVSHRVVLTYSKDPSGKLIIEAVIGGRDPRDKSTVIMPKKDD